MIRAFAQQFDEKGRTVAVTDVNPADGLRLLNQSQHRVWFDLCTPSDDDYAWLQQSFSFHPLTIEDCKQHDPRAKLSEYDGYVFITLHAPLDDSSQQMSDEIHIFIGANYFVTVNERPNPLVENLNTLQRRNFQLSEWGPSFLFYRLCDLVVDAYFPVLDEIDDRVDALEDNLLSHLDRIQLDEIFSLKRDLVFLRKTVGPMREVFNALLIRRNALIDERALLYLRDVYDHIIRFYDIIDSQRDLVSNALDIYLSTVSNNLSQIMKRLTIITTIFMPLTFVTGFFGMNFAHLPFDQDWVFWVAMLIMFGGAASLLWWFKREGWL
jgi:magnesium transporter